MFRPLIKLLNVRKLCTKQGNEIMKYLNVAEKNDAAKNIAGLLSRGASSRREGLSQYNKIYEFKYNVQGKDVQMVMTSVSGHLLSFEFMQSFRGWQSCSPEQLFTAPVKKNCPLNYEKIRSTLQREVRQCSALIVWTDCDREGENIGFEIIDVCREIKPNIRVWRAKFSEITTASVKRALQTLGEPDLKQSQAVDVRSELDLRIGAAFTRFQTLRLQNVFPNQISDSLVSYGSCQIPTLGFVVDRYKQIEDFVAQDFWKIKLSHTIDDVTVDFSWARNRLFDKNCCQAYVMLCQADPTATVLNVTEKPKSKWRPTAMDTVELEKLGSRKLKISAKQTMTIAEKLYTGGYISYPRTETNIFSNEVDLNKLVEEQLPHPDWGRFAQKVLEWGPNPRNGKKSDQAHPPIHPTKYTDGLNGDEKRVYELIVRHFLACLSRDAFGQETVVNVTVASEDFTATGLVIKERNYLDVYPYERWNAKEVHNYERGNTFEPTELSLQEGKTSKPNLLTEADLIALMDKHSIGTDATHAEHINTIKERQYIGEHNGGLMPGVLGMGLVEGYNAMQLDLAQPKLRAGLEKDLDAICKGKKDPKQVLAQQIEIYKQAYRVITEKALLLDEKIGNRFQEVPRVAPVINIDAPQIDEVSKCPKCAQMMALRSKKDNAGKYLGCLGFPDCKNAVWFGDEIKEVSTSDVFCPKCGPPNKKLRFKFKQMRFYGLLQSPNFEYYETCIICDSQFRSLMGIKDESVKKLVGVDAATNVLNNSRINNAYNQPTRNTSPPPRRNMPPPPAPRQNMPPPPAPRQNMPPPPAPRQSRPPAGNRRRNYDDDDDDDDNDRGGGAIRARSLNRTSNPPPSPAGVDVRMCRCNQPAVQRTVRKEGPNTGRLFWVCANSESCKFFEWHDASPNKNSFNNNNSISSTTSSKGRTKPPSEPNPNKKARRCTLCRQEGHTKNKCPSRGDD